MLGFCLIMAARLGHVTLRLHLDRAGETRFRLLLVDT
jgi:hypothetical protein